MAPCESVPVPDTRLPSQPRFYQPQPCPRHLSPSLPPLQSLSPRFSRHLLPPWQPQACTFLLPPSALPPRPSQVLPCGSEPLPASPSAQKVILLPSAAVPELQVPDACAAQRDEGAGRPEEGATPRFLQHPQGGPSPPSRTLHLCPASPSRAWVPTQHPV